MLLMMMLMMMMLMMMMVRMMMMVMVNIVIFSINDYFPCSGIERLGHEGRKDMGRLGSWMQPHIDRIGQRVGQGG